MKVRTILAVPFLLTWVNVAFSAAPQVTTTFDRRSIAIDQEINLTIRISGAEGNLQRPRLPAIESFTSYYTGRSSQTQRTDNESTTVAEFNFILVPKAVGKFRFPAIEVQIDDQIYRTDSIELEVLGTPDYQPPPSNTGSPSMNAGRIATTTPQAAQGTVPGPVAPGPPKGFIPIGADRDIFVKAWADKTIVYPNEQILLTYSLYTRADTQYEGFEEEPMITGFWIESFPNPTKLDKTIISISGERYVRADIRKLALFPQGGEDATILPGTLKASVEERARRRSVFDDFFDDSFFSNRLYSKRIPKLLVTEPIDIKIKPFPAQGKPTQFNGAVGNFTLRGSIDTRSVKQNEPLTLTLAIEGEGNIETLERPVLPDLSHVQMYDSDVSTNLVKRSDKIRGQKVFEVVLIPQETGTLSIPKIVFSFFDPVSESYKTEETGPFQVNVMPGEVEREPSETLPRRNEERVRKGIEVEARGIFFIKENKQTRPWERVYAYLYRWMWANGIMSVLATLLFFYRRSQDILDTDVALKRKKQAPRVIRKGIRSLNRSMKDMSSDGHMLFSTVAERTMARYMSDRMNVSAQGLTHQAIIDELKKSAVPQSLLESVGRFYATCDEVRFTHRPLERSDRNELIRTIEEVVGVMEKRRVR